MMKTVKSISIFILLVIASYSCRKDCIEESGTIITDYIDISGFTGISTEGEFDVIIDTGSYEVSVEADRAFIPYVKFDKTGDVLNIYVANNHCLDGRRPVIHIYAPDIDYIAQLGSGTIKCRDLYNDELTIENEASGHVEIYNLDTYNVYAYLTGSGSIYLDGIAKFANYNVSSSGVIDGLDFEIDRGNVLLSGSGEVYVNAFLNLDIVISGSGTVFYVDHYNLSLQYSIPGSGEVVMY